MIKVVQYSSSSTLHFNNMYIHIHMYTCTIGLRFLYQNIQIAHPGITLHPIVNMHPYKTSKNKPF